MKQLFAQYDIAVMANENGFNELCICNWFVPVNINEEEISNMQPELKDNKEDSIYIFNVRYKNKVSAPLYQQLVDFFREKHDMVINVYANASGYLFEFHDSAKKGGTHRYDSGYTGTNDSGCWDNYYDAFNAALKEAFIIIN